MKHALTRFEPFRDLNRFSLFRRLDDMFSAPTDDAALDEAPIPLDIAETDDAYTVRAVMPGMRREDIRVSVQGNRVIVQGECHHDTAKNERMVCRERFIGRQYRAVTLDHDLDEVKANAHYQDGILELTLPKKSGRNGRTLAIH